MEFKYERIKNKNEITEVCKPFLEVISEIFKKSEKKSSFSAILNKFSSEAITSLFNIDKELFNVYEIDFELLRHYFLVKLREDYSVKSTKINIFRSVLIEKKFPYMEKIYDMVNDNLVDDIIDFYKKPEEPKKKSTESKKIIEEIEDIDKNSYEDSDEDIEIKKAIEEIENKRINSVEIPDHINDLEEYYLSHDELNIDAQTEKDKTVICPICGDRMKQITPQHLNKRHGITTAEFRKIFPNAIMRYNPNPGKRSKQAKKILATQNHQHSSEKILTKNEVQKVTKQDNSTAQREKIIEEEVETIEKSKIETPVVEKSIVKESTEDIVEGLFAYKVITTLMDADERYPDLIKDACKEIYNEALKRS